MAHVFYPDHIEGPQLRKMPSNLDIGPAEIPVSGEEGGDVSLYDFVDIPDSPSASSTTPHGGGQVEQAPHTDSLLESTCQFHDPIFEGLAGWYYGSPAQQVTLLT